jgi:hypothetical protein
MLKGAPVIFKYQSNRMPPWNCAGQADSSIRVREKSRNSDDLNEGTKYQYVNRVFCEISANL